MNIHPLIVHFPIALLALYVAFEVLPLDRWYPHVSWQDIKAVLVCFGGLGILAALVTGKLAESSPLAQTAGNILHLHKLFAGASAAIFGIIALAYLARWAFNKHVDFFAPLRKNFPAIGSFSDFVLKRWVVIALALAGFVALFLVGTLGAVMVYGPNNDAVTQAVYSMTKSL